MCGEGGGDEGRDASLRKVRKTVIGWKTGIGVIAWGWKTIDWARRVKVVGVKGGMFH